MPQYTCPECGSIETATAWRGDTGKHHCPTCEAALADSQGHLDWEATV